MYESTRVTSDNEWYEDELQGDVYDVCVEIVTPKLLEQYKYRALKDKDLLLPQYMTEQILNDIDTIELYNAEYEAHCCDKQYDSEGCAIRWFDVAITDIIHKKLKENLIL